MTISAQSVVKEVQRSVNDYVGTRVPATDIVPLINQAQRVIQTVRPDATAAVSTFTLAAGAKQSLPASAATLIDVLSNSNAIGRRITKTDMPLLDSVEPNWRSKAPSATVVHFMHDVRNPRTFWVYPPAIEAAQVEIETSNYPADIPSATGAGWNTVTGNISLADEFEQALIQLVLSFVYRSDLEGAMNVALADGYMQKASTLLGVQLTTSNSVAPKE